MKKFKGLCFILALIFSIGVAGNLTVYADFGDDIVSEQYTEPEMYSPMFNLPHNMRGTIIMPEIDFYTSEENTITEVSMQLDTIYEKLIDIGMNSVILGTSGERGVYYNLNMNQTDSDDFLALAVEKARQLGLNVYLIYDLGRVTSNHETQSDSINTLISEIHRFTLKYISDGILLDNYYAEKTAKSFKKYMESGSGIGYENWLYDMTEYFVKTASSVVKMTDNSVPVGLMINDMWANSSSNENGSPTNDIFEAYYDGFADTKYFVEKSYADFIMLRSYGKIGDGALPFTETAQWWGKLCEQNEKIMYILHQNEKIGNTWGEDQLLQQLITAKDEITAYNGSVFNSYQTLSANVSNSAGTLKKYYESKINEDSVFEGLIMTSPKNFNFTTYEPIVQFAGTFDENFDVYLNNSKIALNKAGNFYFEKELSTGANTFTITHKSKTYTYKIERKIVTLKDIGSSIAEGKKLKVEGGTTIELEATAYKGSEVYATINGQTISLKQRSTTLNDEDPNSTYVGFTGKYTVPEGIIDTEQPLGKISITANYMSYTRTAVGAAVTVIAKPRPPVINIGAQMYDENTVGTGEIVGTIDDTHFADEWYTYVKINNNYTQIFDAKTTGSAMMDPDLGQLPAGTIDYFGSDVGGFYTTDSGKRFKSAETTLVEDYGIGENNLVVKGLGTSNGDSFIKLGLDTKISYNVQTVGNSYFTNWGTDYNINSFNAKYIYITFDNVTSVTKLPSFDTSLVFSGGSWEQVVVNEIPKFRLVLTLRQPGVYAGNGAYYDENGDLMLTFPVLQNSLSGMNIVIDPGHGYGVTASSKDPGAIGHVVEQEVNLAVAKELTAILQSYGANVTRLKTESDYIYTATRPIVGRQYGCDLFISLHSNTSVQDDTVRGTEVYYFTPFSQPLAASISKNVSSYFTKNVYSDGADKNRGAKFQIFWVTLQQDFPSVLVEMGFVSNMEDAMALANSADQKGIAKGIAKGIIEYASRSTLGSGTNQSVTVDTPEEAPSDTPSDTTPEETTTTSFDISDFDDDEFDDTDDISSDFDDDDIIDELED